MIRIARCVGGWLHYADCVLHIDGSQIHIGGVSNSFGGAYWDPQTHWWGPGGARGLRLMLFRVGDSLLGGLTSCAR